MEGLGFYLFGAITLAGALLMVTARNPLHGVLWLVVSFLGLSGLFGGLGADFLAAVQILVYAGAILVLFLFVVMLLNLRFDDVRVMPGITLRGAAGGFVFGVLGFVGLVAMVVLGSVSFRRPIAELHAGLSGGPAAIAVPLFRDFLLPFEIVSVLLLAAIVGSVADEAEAPVILAASLPPVTIQHYLLLSGLLFAVGLAGVLLRRNIIIILMSLELMLSAANLAFVTFSRVHGNLQGQVMVFFSIAVAAAEAAVALSILIALYRARRGIDVEDAAELKG